MSANIRFPYRFITAIIIVGLVSFMIPPEPTRAVSNSLVISQFQVGGATSSDEFIEIHNVSSHSQDINGFKLAFRPLAGSIDTVLVTWATSTVIPAGGFYLITSDTGYDGAPIADITFADEGGGKLSGSAGGLGLRNSSNVLVDSVGYGIATNIFVETTPTNVPPANQSGSRLGGGCTDTDNNLNDFILTNPSSSRNTSATAVFCVPPDLAPVITTTNPLNGALQVLPGTNIMLEFNEPVTISLDGFFNLICNSVEQDGIAIGSGNLYTIDPSVDMPNDAFCEVTIHASAVVDQDVPLDHMAADYVFGFTIAPVDDPPGIVSTIPDKDVTGVLVDTLIRITFSEEVSLDAGFASIGCTSGNHTYTVYDIDNPVIVITPDVDLSFGDACTVTIDHTKVTDQDGQLDVMESDYIWNFTTFTDPAPYITAVMPLQEAVGVPLNANISITFSEPVDISPGWYSISCFSSGVHLADGAGGPTAFTLAPRFRFHFGELCTVSLDHTLITDQDGDDPADQMASDFTWEFQIKPADNFIYLSLVMKSP